MEGSTNSPGRLRATSTISWTCDRGLFLFDGLGVVETRRLGRISRLACDAYSVGVVVGVVVLFLLCHVLYED